MIDIASDLLSLSPLLETSRENDARFENLALFADFSSTVQSSLAEPPTTPVPPVRTAPAPTFNGPTAAPSASPAPSQAAPSRLVRQANPLLEALRARASQRMTNSRILKPKPLP